MIITEAPHLCMPRTNSPMKTLLVRLVIELYASVEDGV